MLLTPAAASRSQTDWATSAGVVMTPMEARVAVTTSSSSSIGRTVSPPMRCPMRAGAASNSPTNSKPRRAEARVVGQRGPQVPDADQHAGPRPLHAEDGGDPVPQGRDLVADAADAARAQVREVLAQPGRVDPGRSGQLAG